jgi:hypothetical protein
MLILAVGTGTAAESRIVETLLGAAPGLLTGLVFARPTVQPAEEAMSDLCDRIATLLTRMAAGLLAGPVREQSAGWLAESRDLAREIRIVDEALRRAEESIRLNPRRVMLPRTEFNLRHVLETLEYAAITVRGIARSIADNAGLAEDKSPVRDQDIRDRLAAVLEELAGAVSAYGNSPRRTARLSTIWWRPRCVSIWQRRTIGKPRSVNCLVRIRQSGRLAGRCAASWSATSIGCAPSSRQPAPVKSTRRSGNGAGGRGDWPGNGDGDGRRAGCWQDAAHARAPAERGPGRGEDRGSLQA